jgi:hypothetical protein
MQTESRKVMLLPLLTSDVSLPAELKLAAHASPAMQSSPLKTHESSTRTLLPLISYPSVLNGKTLGVSRS